MPNGSGTCTYANKDIYEGEWLNGLKEGKGTYTLSNGDKYIGIFKNDLPNGDGLFVQGKKQA